MINSIITNSKIPQIFKISRILPISKPNKPLDKIDSYRPINNLPCLENFLEQHIQIHLINFLDQN